MTILNEDKVALRDMSNESASELFVAIMEDRAQLWVQCDKRWVDICFISKIDTSYAYRTKPKEIKAPWEWFEDWIQWIAMDADGCWCAFKEKPTLGCAAWIHDNRFTYITGIKIDKGDGDWTQQIQQRPDK